MVGAAFAVAGSRKAKAGKKGVPLRASTQDVLFKGGAGSVDGGTGAGSFTATSSSSSSSSSAASASVSETGLGIQAPLGFWDPLGLSRDAATLNRRRAVEIKHGRVAMYATMGYIVPEYYKFPGARVKAA